MTTKGKKCSKLTRPVLEVQKGEGSELEEYLRLLRLAFKTPTFKRQSDL
jgi:hypothetical protein